MSAFHPIISNGFFLSLATQVPLDVAGVSKVDFTPLGICSYLC